MLNKPHRHKDDYFVFREVRNVDELLELLKLRYEVYINSRLKGFLNENPEQIDVDLYDVKARHFGLYRVNSRTKILIGCIRVVNVNIITRSATMIEYLKKYYTSINKSVNADFDAPLPMLTYGPEGKTIERQYNHWINDGEHVVEVGRLCLHTDFRDLRLARILAESTLALGFYGRYNVDRALFTCNCSHKLFYRKYGFAQISGTSDKFWTKPGASGVALMSTPNDIPHFIRKRLQNMADEFDNSSSIIYSQKKPQRRPADLKSIKMKQAEAYVAA